MDRVLAGIITQRTLATLSTRSEPRRPVLLDANQPVRCLIGFAYSADPVQTIFAMSEVDDPHRANTLPNRVNVQFEVHYIDVQRAWGDSFSR